MIDDPFASKKERERAKTRAPKPKPKAKPKKQKPAYMPPPGPFVPPAKLPFRVLGIGDDTRAYFVGIHSRLQNELPKKFNKSFLLTLADVSWWQDNFSDEKNKMKWDIAISFLLEAALNADFDPLLIRGRGAWRECDGRICYHDGKYTTGEASDKRLYLRKTRKDIGLKSADATPELRMEIMDNIKQLSFATGADWCRIMGWTALSPFSGALPWRPCGFITGPSKSGKSTVINYIVRKIAQPEAFSGGTTEAAIRQAVANDSCAVIIEESEKDTKKKKQATEDLFSLMRMSTSDDAPIIAKGTSEGRAQIFRMSNMFLFVAIDPTVGNIADENRIFRIEMTKPNEEQKLDWKKLSSNISRLTTPENCAAIRALTWRRLPEILKYAEYLEPIIRGVTGRDNRFSYAEGLLLAAYWIIWLDMKPLDDQAELGVKTLYAMKPLGDGRDETTDLLERLLSESVRCEIPIDLSSYQKGQYSLGQILAAVHTSRLDDIHLGVNAKSYLRNIAGQFGVGVTANGELAIANNHHEIKKIIERTAGYHLQLHRHPGLVDKSKRMLIAGRTTVCTTIQGCLSIDDEE